MTVFHLKNRNMPAEAFAELKNILTYEITERKCKVMRRNEGAITLEFAVDSRMKADSYRVVKKEDGSYVVSANTTVTVFAGVGRFLVLSVFDGKGGFTPAACPISHKMKKSIRGIYLATHFYNFHHNAPIELECRHVLEQALRGFNAVMLCLAPQHYTSFETPEALEMIARLKQQLAIAKKIGMSTALVGFSNTGFSDFKNAAQFKMDESGRYQRDITAEFLTEVCPSLPAGYEEIEDLQRQFLSAFRDTDLDYIYLWPWDEGGCLCEKCYPWTTNGFMKCADMVRRILKEYGMKTQLCISTWHFGNQMPGEWENFWKHLAAGEYSWAPYVMVSFQSTKPDNVLRDNAIPEGVKFVDFPEISMQNPAKPWGGYGATPFPMYLNNLEEYTGYLNDGGYLYSEGIYEDVNKFICAGFYCGYYTDANEAMRDYFRFEFGIEDREAQNELIRASELMETTHRKNFSAPADGTPWTFGPRFGNPVPETKRIIDRIDKTVGKAWKNSWKWRLYVIRANVEAEIINSWRRDGTLTLKNSEIAQKYLRELWDISCCCEKTKLAVYVPVGK